MAVHPITIGLHLRNVLATATKNKLRLIALIVLFTFSQGRLRENNLTEECKYYLIPMVFEESSNSSPSEMHTCEIHGKRVIAHGITDDFWRTNKKRLISGESNLIFPMGYLVNYVLNVVDENLLEIETRSSSIAGNEKEKGKKKVLAIRVEANDSSTSMTMKEMRKRMFTAEPSLKYQYKKCSFNKLKLAPFKGKTKTGVKVKGGVGEINISVNVKGNDKSKVESKMIDAATEKYGDLESQFDHVIFCMPPGTGTWLAYAQANGWKSVYNDLWCDNLSTLQHEIGHNIRLGHSGEGNEDYGYYQYGDESCPMGFGSYNTHLGIKEGVDRPRCFNGAKSWQLGWYTKGHVTVNPSSPTFEGNLIGVVYYNNLKSDKVLVKIEGNKDYFVAFNHKAKFNKLPLEGADLVLITSSKYEYNGDSNLEARLDEGDSYVVEGTYTIKVTKINKSSDRYYAKVKITVDENCPCKDIDPCNTKKCSSQGYCVTEQNCSKCGKSSVFVEVVTDNSPKKTSWNIVDVKNDEKVVENDLIKNKFAMYNKRVCLGKGDYEFTMEKSGKDVCCPKTREGNYALSVDGGLIKQDILSNGKKDRIQFSIK